MSWVQRLIIWLCGKFDVPLWLVPTPKQLSFVRQISEERGVFEMAKIDIAVMEVELPDATLARNVDVQKLEVRFEDPKYAVYNQDFVFGPEVRVAQYRVPEGSVYKLSLGYCDEQNDGSMQVSWSEPVTLTHEDTLAPDAPGPFGAIRMLDETEEEGPEDPITDPGVEDPITDPGVEDPITDPGVEDPVTDPGAEDPVSDESPDGPIEEENGPALD